VTKYSRISSYTVFRSPGPHIQYVHLIPSEFPCICRKFPHCFYQCCTVDSICSQQYVITQIVTIKPGHHSRQPMPSPLANPPPTPPPPPGDTVQIPGKLQVSGLYYSVQDTCTVLHVCRATVTKSRYTQRYTVNEHNWLTMYVGILQICVYVCIQSCCMDMSHVALPT
jgi:hypothetical protein